MTRYWFAVLLLASTSPGAYEIDSISPVEATTTISRLNATCQPKRPWALWYSSGRYQFTAQRTSLYDDPLGAVGIRGTFVAPLLTYQAPCSG